MLSTGDIALICSARHGDPFAVLGAHAVDGGWELRSYQPGASAVTAIDAVSGAELARLERREATGFFEGAGHGAPPRNYRLQVRWSDGNESTLDDPYRHDPVLGEMDTWLLAEGSHLRPWEVLGARLAVKDGVAGTSFAVWAPNAARVAVVGDFNHWDGRRHPMRLRRECGVWEILLPGVLAGAR